MGGRGRARGRSNPQYQQEGQPRRPGPGGPEAQRGAPRGAWGGGPPRQPQPQQPPMRQQGPPQQAPPPPQGVWGAPRQGAPPPVQQTVGRATHRGGGESVGAHSSSAAVQEIVGDVAGDGNGAHSGVQRGAHRGKRQLHESILRTKPENMDSKKGTSGKHCKLSANYFQVLQKPDWCLFQYRVDYSPEIDSTIQKKGMFRTAVSSLNLSGYLFDGTVMYTPRRINPNPLELFVDPLDGQGTEKIRITIRLVGDVNMGDYHYIQVFNIILRKCMGHLKLQLVGRNFYDAAAKVMIPQYNLELWPGYVTSIRQHESNILLCVEITYKVMRNDTVYHLLMECSKEDRANVKKLFAERVIGKVVLTGYNNRTYRIDDVDFAMTPESGFKKKDGSSITFTEYYREKYGVFVTQKNQPLLISQAKPRELRAGMAETIILVPELCRMTGLTDAQRANFTLMRSLADHTRVGPVQRIEKLHHFSNRLTTTAPIMAELRQWDLQLANRIIEFNGRVLNQETLQADEGRQSYQSGQFVDWTKELRSRKQFCDVPIKKWAVVCPGKVKQSAQKFIGMLATAAKGMKWQLGEPRIFELNDDKIGSYLGALDTVIDANVDLIMIVVMNNKADRYSALKKKCCVDRAVPTQVICARNLDSKGAMSIATKVAIQMNCKVGGAPWSVNIPLKGLMVVGYDVCHDPQNKQKSFGAMVASLDNNITRYFSTASAHSSGEELSNDFALNMVKAVKEYQKVHAEEKPQRILIFRDGVGDGQLPYVHEHEVSKIVKELEVYYGGPVKLAFIIVSKRINTRIFCGQQNPEPGTVIDDVVTLPERYDYYIVSQCTRQGTVSPTSYNVIYDTFGLPPDRLQMLTYKLTHMYFNWSGTVRVPAPCQYAHKLAFLVAQSLHRTPNAGLEKLLYYL